MLQLQTGIVSTPRGELGSAVDGKTALQLEQSRVPCFLMYTLPKGTWAQLPVNGDSTREKDPGSEVFEKL